MSWFENPGTKIYEGLDLSKLHVDEAYVNITSRLEDQAVDLEQLSDDCYNCPFVKFATLPATQHMVVKINTARNIHWQVKRNSSIICQVSPEIGEFGVYNFEIDESNCIFSVTKTPVNIYLPLLVIVLSILLLAIIIKLISFLWKKYKSQADVPQLEGGIEKDKKRIKSLDVFRGISIVLMIFVNSGGGHYWWMEHATWNGLHVADIVFPFFLWIMGVCIPISLISQLRRNVPRRQLLRNISRRAIILFSLGLMLNTVTGHNDLKEIRIMGVLQRFGIVYFIVASLSALMVSRESNVQPRRFVNAGPDIQVLLPQWLIIIPIVMVHCGITFLFNVPGCPTGYLGPGGIEGNGTNYKCIGGATGYIDRKVLAQHMYQHPTSDKVYSSGPFDPEGILGCLTSILQVFLGVHAGTVIVFHKIWKVRIIHWLAWSAFLGIVGGAFCSFSKEDGLIPVNKNLWSLTFVFVTSSFAFFLLAVCYIIIDVKSIWKGDPFLYPGMNSTIMYVGHSMAHGAFPWHWKIGNMNTHYILTVEALWNTSLWIIIAYVLYRKKIFFSI